MLISDFHNERPSTPLIWLFVDPRSNVSLRGIITRPGVQVVYTGRHFVRRLSGYDGNVLPCWHVIFWFWIISIRKSRWEWCGLMSSHGIGKTMSGWRRRSKVLPCFILIYFPWSSIFKGDHSGFTFGGFGNILLGIRWMKHMLLTTRHSCHRKVTGTFRFIVK